MHTSSLHTTFSFHHTLHAFALASAPVLACCLLFGNNPNVQAGVVDFTGINLPQVSSASGQNFGYIEGVSGPAGTLNVKLVSGPVDVMTTGSSPDPTGFYALQGTPLSIGSPFLFSFSFSSPVNFTIAENETLTSFEENTLSVPASGSIALLSSADAIVTPAANQITFQGATAGGGAPFGTYVVLGSGSAFDFYVLNKPGAFTLYGSSITLNVVPEPGTATGLLLGGVLTVLWRRRRGRSARSRQPE